MTSNWKKRTAGILACLFIMQSLPVSALAVELTEEETQELVNLIPAEPQDAANPVETPADETSEAEQLPETDESEQPTVAIDEPESEAPGTQQPQQEVPAEMIVPAIEVMSEEQDVEEGNIIEIEGVDGQGAISKKDLYNELKESYGDADGISLDSKAYRLNLGDWQIELKKTDAFSNGSVTLHQGVYQVEKYTKINAWGKSDYVVQSPSLAVNIKEMQNASIEVREGQSVALPYKDISTVDYDALRKAIFDAVVASTTPKLTYSEVSIQYEATATTGIFKEWMPLEGGKDTLTYPAISVGEHKIKISWGGNDSYYSTSAEVDVTITERTTPSITLNDIDTINVAGKEWSAIHAEILSAAIIDNGIDLTTDNTKVQYLKDKLIGNGEWTDVNASNFGELQEKDVKIRVIYEGSAAYTNCTSNEIEVRFVTKSDSSIVVKEDQSVALPYTDASTVDYDALENAIFEAVVGSTIPEEISADNVTILYEATYKLFDMGDKAAASDIGKKWVPLGGEKEALGFYPAISEGQQKIKISWDGNETYYGFEEEVTVNITEREQAPYTLKKTPDSVVLAVDENLKVDYDALHDAIFSAVVESSEVLTSNNVSIEYYYAGLTPVDSKWLPLEGQSVVGGLGYPAISAGERKIRISYAGDSTYAPTTIEATITVADREQVQFQLKNGPYEVGMVYDAEQGYDYAATARAIYNAVVESTMPAVAFEDVKLEFRKSRLDYYKPLDQGSLLGEFGVGTWDIRISVADTQAYRGRSIEVDVTTDDNRIDSAVVLKNGASFTYNMDPTVMKQATFENVIDWEQSELPDKNTLSLDNFVIEYKAKLTDLESGIDIDLGDIPGLDSDVLTQWVPIEGKEYSIAGTVLGGFPQMGAGENQQIRLSYKGNADYKPSAKTEGTVTVNKAKVSVKVNSTNIYADETLTADFITTNPADEFDIYTIYAGITSNVTTGIYLDLPERYTESAFLKVLDPVVEAIYGKSFTQMMNDGVTVGELRELFSTQELLELLDKLNIDTGTFGEILNVINKLPSIMDSVRVSFGEPNRAGLYTVAAVTDNKNYETGVGMGFLLVKMRMSGAHLTWDDEITGGKLTAEQAKTFDFGATLSYDGDPSVDQSGVHYLYSGFTSKWRIYSSTTTPPTEPGRYVVTVCILGGNYMAAPITRSFQITK